MSLPREQRAARVRAELLRRNMTRHAATLRLDISRPAMEKLWEGKHVDLTTVEAFARGLRLSVNEWRHMWGFPPVEPTPSEAVEALRDREPIEVRRALGQRGAENLAALAERIAAMPDAEGE